MNPRTRQYLFGAIFLAVAIYQLVAGELLEAALYGSAGLAFILNTMTLDARLIRYKRPLVIATWTFIAVTGVLFLYLLQFKYF